MDKSDPVPAGCEIPEAMRMSPGRLLRMVLNTFKEVDGMVITQDRAREAVDAYYTDADMGFEFTEETPSALLGILEPEPREMTEEQASLISMSCQQGQLDRNKVFENIQRIKQLYVLYDLFLRNPDQRLEDDKTLD